MKLIYVLNHYAHNSSSHFYHIIPLLEEMAKKGVEIALIIEKCEDIPHFKHKGIKLYPINSGKIKRLFKMTKVLLGLSKKEYKKVFIRISWPAAMVAIGISWFTGQKTYYWLSGQGNIEYYRALKPGIRKFVVWLKSQLPLRFIKNNISYFATGPESMAVYYRKTLKVDSKKLLLLYNDIDIRRFYSPDEEEKLHWRQQFSLPPDKQIILFVHRFSPVRRTGFYLPYIIDSFFNAMNNENSLFILVGDGPEKSGIEKQIVEGPYNENIIFTGNMPNAKIEQIYKCADIFILPSYSEGFPRTLIEAMACGLPLVSTDAGGIRDILGLRQLKYMVAIDDRKAFAEKLILLADDPKTRRILTQENLQSVKKYSTEAVAEMYIDKICNEIS